MSFEIHTKPEGGIRIQFGSETLTRLVRPASSADDEYLDAPPEDLALWLILNWWRLRYEPIPTSHEQPRIEELPTEWRLAHDLRSIEGGYRWPPAVIWGDDASVLAMAESDPVGITAPVRYIGSHRTVTIPAAEFESGAGQFLQSFGGAREISHMWDSVLEERSNPDFSAWRRMEAKLGFDADQAPESVMEQMGKLAARYGSRNIEEAACAAPGIAAAATLQGLIERAHSNEARECRFAAATEALPAVQVASAAPWQAAEIMAASIRKQVGDNDNLSDKALSELCGTQPDAFSDIHGSKPQYGISVGGNGQNRVIVQSRWREGRRFQFARAFGDYLFSSLGIPEGLQTLGPIAASATSRQKFQRAFGAALLCPIERLRLFLTDPMPDRDDIEAAAKHFEVSPRLVRSTLQNHHVPFAA